MEILQHDEHGLLARFGGEPILEGTAHLVAHQDGIVTRGAELDVVFLGHRNAEGLREELRHADEVALRDGARDAGTNLLALDARRLAILRVGGGADDLREHAER